MLKKEINSLTGVNLRLESSDLQDGESIFSENADIASKPGVINIRRGKSTLSDTTLADLIIRYLSKVNGFRYQIAGRTVYRDMSAITSNQALDVRQIETTIQAFRDLSDAYIWAFIADDALMLKDNGTVLYQWGIDLLPTPDPQLCNQTGKNPSDTITAGTYTAAVTQIRFVNPDTQGPDFVGEIEGAL